MEGSRCGAGRNACRPSGDSHFEKLPHRAVLGSHTCARVLPVVVGSEGWNEACSGSLIEACVGVTHNGMRKTRTGLTGTHSRRASTSGALKPRGAGGSPGVSACLIFCLAVYLYASGRLSAVWLSVWPSDRLSLCLAICLRVRFAWLPAWLLAWLLTLAAVRLARHSVCPSDPSASLRAHPSGGLPVDRSGRGSLAARPSPYADRPCHQTVHACHAAKLPIPATTPPEDVNSGPAALGGVVVQS